MRLIFSISFVFISLIIIAQGDADCKQSNAFNGIHVYDGVIVTLERGEKDELCPAAGTKLDDLNISIVDSVLRIRKISGQQYKSSPAVRVKYRSLRIINASSKADIDTRNLITRDSLSIKMRSGATMYAEMDVKVLKVSLSEGANLTSKGYALKQNITSVTKATFNAFELEGEEASLKVNTGGKAKINIEKHTTGSVTAGGYVNYKGKPTIDVKTTLGGKMVSYSE